MAKDLSGINERAKERTTRRWKKHEISERFKKMRATGEGSEKFTVIDGKKYFSTEVPKPPKEAPQPADVIENEDPRVSKLETKFLKDIREMMEGHKFRNAEVQLALIAQERRKLLKEKLRRLEAGTWTAQREGAKS